MTLQEAVWAVESDLENRLPDHPQVKILRGIRNDLMDDIGWNERQQ